jgi:hexulose-6-phosphate isomerase
MKRSIGVMQGRLSSLSNGKIQSFPWKTWEKEFELATDLGLNSIEWTIDLQNFEEHPLLNKNLTNRILALREEFPIQSNSITCDFFMQFDPWSNSQSLSELLAKFESLALSKVVTPGFVFVIPLVDLGSPKNHSDWEDLRSFLRDLAPALLQNSLLVAFEFDIEPVNQMLFLDSLGSDCFGVNFDSGNSASYGFEPKSELQTISSKLFNVHIKDRILGAHTVPLGTGATNFYEVSRTLDEIEYSGSLVLQGARQPQISEIETIRQYIVFCQEMGLV